MDENVALLDQVLTTPRLTYSPLIFLLQFYYHSSESLFGAYSIWLNCLHFQAKKWNMDIFPVEIALSFFPATSNYFILIASLLTLGFPSGSAGKKSACNVGDLGSIPGLGRSLGERKGYPLQYSGLENSMDCIVHGVAKSRTRLSDFHFHKDFLALRHKNQRYKLLGGMWQKFRWSHIFLHSKFLGQKNKSQYLSAPPRYQTETPSSWKHSS